MENLAGRNIILHTDGARAYQCNGHRPPGVKHDWVVRAKQRVQTPHGVQIWKRPKFMNVVSRTLPGGRPHYEWNPLSKKEFTSNWPNCARKSGNDNGRRVPEASLLYLPI